MTTLNVGGVDRETSQIRINVAGVLRTVSAISLNQGGTLRPLAGGGGEISATLAPSGVGGYAYSIGEPRITTSAVTITVTGGTAPYTIVWNFVESSWEEVTPNSLTTTLRGPGTPPATTDTTNLYAALTDSLGASCITNSISASVSNEHPGV